jgi:uncharacterized membrane protein
MRSRLVVLSVLPVLLFTLASVTVLAQEAPNQPGVLNNPSVNLPVQFDVSPPLLDLAAQTPPQAGSHGAPVVQRPKLQLLHRVAAQGHGPAPDGALQTTVGPLVNTTDGLNLLGVGNGFPNYSVPDAPSDVNLAVGDTQVVQWVNVSYAVFDKTSGAILAGPIAGNAFWAGFGGACQSSNSGDPIVQWDKIAHRWVMVQNVFSSPYMTCIAISQTPDATGSYYRFAFPQSAGFPDYPKWGLMPDAYYQTQNIFNNSGTAFLGVNVCAYERAKLLTGDSTAKQVCIFDNSNGTLFDDSLLPADLDSPGTPPPAGQDEVLLGSIDNANPGTMVYEYLFHVDFVGSGSTLTGVNGSMPITVSTYNLACGGFGACIPQKDVTYSLDSLGDRLMYRLAYRNFSDHQTWLVSHSVTAGSSVGERWYEFHAPETTTNLSVFQQGTFAPDSNYRWMGSIAMDQSQDIALGYSVSSSTMYPSISYTGWVPGDTLGQMEAEALIVGGAGSQIGTSNRWGDYTSIALDAQDDCTFWYTNQYYATTASFDWSTRLASFKFDGCGGTPEPSFTLTNNSSTQTVTAGGSATFHLTLTSNNGYSGNVSLGISGQPTDVTLTSPTSPVSVSANGSTNFDLVLATDPSTAAGTYNITVTGTNGSLNSSTIVQLMVNNSGSPPDFAVSAASGTITVPVNSSSTDNIALTPSNGFTGNISLSLSGLPPRTSSSFSSNSVSIGPDPGSSVLTISANRRATQGYYSLMLTATSGSLSHSIPLTLVVGTPPSPDFSLSASPSSQTVVQGSPTNYTVTVTASGGFTGTVSFTVSGLTATGTTYTLPSVSGGSGQSTLHITTSSTTPTGNYSLTITGTSGGLQHTASVTLVVSTAPTGSITLSSSPASLSISRGSSGSSTISVQVTNYSPGTVYLSVSGAPSRTSVSLNPTSVSVGTSGTQNSTLSVQVNRNAGRGNYSLTITGKDSTGTIVKTVTVPLTIT